MYENHAVLYQPLVKGSETGLDPAQLELDLLPGYRVRESARARIVHLKMTPHEGLVIVVPTGYNLDRLPSILNEKKSWIEKATRWADEQRLMKPLEPLTRPEAVRLEAIGEIWTVFYRPTEGSRTSAREHSDNRLLVSEGSSDISAITTALKRWTARKARHHLVPWLQTLSDSLEMPFDAATIRNQRSLWASCSPGRTISLNQKLLLLPEDLVRYVLVHELCHTIHLNHSKRFWSLIGKHEPDFKPLRRQLANAWEYVPRWLEE